MPNDSDIGFRGFYSCLPRELRSVSSERLRRCARTECGAIFVKRKRGKYCSEACLQAERKRRYVNNHTKAELKEMRRKYYEKSLNPGVARA